MEKLDILEYLKHTPENTNPVILNQLITEYGEEHVPQGNDDFYVHFTYHEPDQGYEYLESDVTSGEIINNYKSGKRVYFILQPTDIPSRSYDIVNQLIEIFGIDDPDSTFELHFSKSYRIDGKPGRGQTHFMGVYYVQNNEMNQPIILEFEPVE